MKNKIDSLFLEYVNGIIYTKRKLMNQQQAMMTERERIDFERYWSAENFYNRLYEMEIDDLTWQNEELKTTVTNQQSQIQELSAQLEAARKQIRELTGEPEPEAHVEAEDDSMCVPLVRQHCGMNLYEEDYVATLPVRQTCWNPDVEEDYVATLPVRQLSGANNNYLEQRFNIEIQGTGNSNERINNSFFGIIPSDCEPLEQA